MFQIGLSVMLVVSLCMSLAIQPLPMLIAVVEWKSRAVAVNVEVGNQQRALCPGRQGRRSRRRLVRRKRKSSAKRQDWCRLRWVKRGGEALLVKTLLEASQTEQVQLVEAKVDEPSPEAKPIEAVWDRVVVEAGVSEAVDKPQLEVMCIERVDSLPLIVHWLKKMHIQVIIDATWQPHGNWQGLSYGQLAVLFLTYVLHEHVHRLSSMEDWVIEHHTVLEQITGWQIGLKDATDDRLGILLGDLGADEDKMVSFQQQLGQYLIRAYALPTEVGRYDTTTYSVHHTVSQANQASQTVVQRGHSKDYRPDLGQFKQGLATLDPAGLPLLSAILPGNVADDPLYVPAWRQMVHIIGHKGFLYIADCKAAAVETRATLDHEGGCYLFPLPMTGKVPERLREWVLNPPTQPKPICLDDVLDQQGKPLELGQGFIVEQHKSAQLEAGTPHTWTERWLVTQSYAHAHRQRQALQARLCKVQDELHHLRPKQEESAADLLIRAEAILHRYKVTDLIHLAVEQTFTYQKRYTRPGRPTPDSPHKLIQQRHLQLHFSQDEIALQQRLKLAGWRIYVTNTSHTQLSLNQAVAYYRDEWLVEHNFHRLKRGCLPALPLWLRLPHRIRGLMSLLTVALQALTLIEFVARRALKTNQETIAGLVPGNPKMKTARPTAERLLAQFSNLHLSITKTETHISGHLVETLSPLQHRILALLNVPETIYDLTFQQSALQHKPGVPT